MPWDIVFYKAADESVPTDDFLDACPVKVRAQLLAVLDAVAEAPPPRFSGGGRWEAMHGDMGGTRARCFAGAFVMSEVMSKNVDKLIAILATFSWTGHNQATLDFSRIAERPGRIGTEHYQPDGTITDWQSGGSRVRVPSPPLASSSRLDLTDFHVWL